MVCGHLLCRGACSSAAIDWAGDGDRPGAGVVRHARHRTAIFTPRYYRKAEAYLRRCQRQVARRKKGSHRRRKAVALLAKAQQHIARQRRDFHHKEARKLVHTYDVIYHEDLRVGNLVRNHSSGQEYHRCGVERSFSPSLLSRLQAPGSECKRWTLRLPVRPVLAVAWSCRRACPFAGIRARSAEPACIGTTMPRSTSCGWAKR